MKWVKECAWRGRESPHASTCRARTLTHTHTRTRTNPNTTQKHTETRTTHTLAQVYIDMTHAATRHLRCAGESADAEDEPFHAADSADSAIDDVITNTKVAGEAAAGQGWWERRQEEITTADRLLQAGAAVVLKMRRAVLKECGFTCSGGIAHNKILAKLGSGLNKPNQQVRRSQS